jgi:hypothetical protein
MDAIIVPTIRPAGQLVRAIELATSTDSFLLVLCSAKASATDIANNMSASGAKGIAIDIPAGYSHSLLTGFATDAFPEAFYGRANNDISVKRNLGLLLGRLVGWEKVLFFDDDLVGIGNREIDQAAVVLSDHAIAGFLPTDFPDNSVVRHAERLSGIEPGVRLTGGALAVNTTEAKGFFPNIYNEDWFFLHDNLSSSVALGTVKQQPYDPFSNPLRAASEEFGDVLAEGIVELSSAGLDCTEATEAGWLRILDRRKQLIDGIRTRVVARRGERNVEAVLTALQAAEAQLQTITPSTCVKYISAWRRDAAVWQNRLDGLPKVVSLTEAIERLGLAEDVREGKHMPISKYQKQTPTTRARNIA